jgi:hypothetical protein
VPAAGNSANSAANVIPINTTAGNDVVVVVAFSSASHRSGVCQRFDFYTAGGSE